MFSPAIVSASARGTCEEIRGGRTGDAILEALWKKCAVKAPSSILASLDKKCTSGTPDERLVGLLLRTHQA